VTDERLAEIRALLSSGQPRGFRAECRELLGEVRQLREDNTEMRRLSVDGEFSPEVVLDHLECAARRCDSSLHESAALLIRRLLKDNAELKDACADRNETSAVNVAEVTT